jgi:hypothetical protein
MAVLRAVAGSPHDEKVFPNSGDDICRPKESGVPIGCDLKLLEVLVLEARPFSGHATQEYLAPSEWCLLVDKLVVDDVVFEVVERDVMKPGINSVQENID